jgi:DnaJ-domain-containing protein 1
MELDHDTGRMDGRCLKGAFEGRSLSTLSDTEVLELFEELERSEAQGAALLEAYLDWRMPDWRDGQARAGDGPNGGPRGGPSGSAGEQRRRRAASSGMGPEEAYAVLGLSEGASPNDIRRAHRGLMKKLHPDQGGSNYLAARINEAKEVLLGST